MPHCNFPMVKTSELSWLTTTIRFFFIRRNNRGILLLITTNTPPFIKHCNFPLIKNLWIHWTITMRALSGKAGNPRISKILDDFLQSYMNMKYIFLDYHSFIFHILIGIFLNQYAPQMQLSHSQNLRILLTNQQLHLCDYFLIRHNNLRILLLITQYSTFNWNLGTPADLLRKMQYTCLRNRRFETALWERWHERLHYVFLEFWMVFSNRNSNMKQTFSECHYLLSRGQCAPLQLSHSQNLRILLTTNDCIYYAITFSFVVIISGYYF